MGWVVRGRAAAQIPPQRFFEAVDGADACGEDFGSRNQPGNVDAISVEV